MIAGSRAATRRLVLNADDPLIADLGRDRDRTSPISASRIPASRWRECSMPPTPSTAEGAERPTGTTSSISGTWVDTSCHACGQDAPGARGQRDARSSSMEHRPRASCSRTPRGDRRIMLPVPGLYNVYNALGAAALAPCVGDFAGSDRQPGWSRWRRRSAAPRRSNLDGIELRLLLIKNPAGGERDPPDTGARGMRTSTLLAILNDHAADGRDVSWIWDADFELIASRVRSVICSGTRAAELALRFKYAGVPADQIRSGPGSSGRPRRRRRGRRRQAAVRDPDLHRVCWSCATSCPARPRQPILGEDRLRLWENDERGDLA